MRSCAAAFGPVGICKVTARSYLRPSPHGLFRWPSPAPRSTGSPARRGNRTVRRPRLSVACDDAVALLLDTRLPGLIAEAVKGGQGIRGFYIADTDDFIYLGVMRKGFVPEEGDAVPMYRIPRDAETRLLIGKLPSFDVAVPETEELRLQLKKTEEVDDPLPPATPVGD
jgi:hypothetical protein